MDIKNPISNNPTIQALIDKTMKELSSSKPPLQSSRTWTHPEGYKFLVQWSNAVLLRYLVTIFTSTVKSFKRKDQLDDAARSVVRDIEEGYKRANTSPYIEFISFSQGSLEEVKGDIRDATQDRLLESRPGSNLASLEINLKDLNTALKDFKGEYRRVEEIYPPLAKIKPSDLSYEIFLELINKTDYLLRVLVQSLEKKLVQEKKGYQVEQARIRDRLKIKR